MHRDPCLYLKVVMKNKQRTRSLLPWSRRKNTEALASSKSENLAEACRSIETSCEFEVAEETSDEDDGSKSSSEESDDDEEEQILSATQNITNQNISEDELLNQVKGLELETEDDIPNTHAQEKEATTTKDFTTLNISEDDIPNIHAQEKEAATTKDINIHAKEKVVVLTTWVDTLFILREGSCTLFPHFRLKILNQTTMILMRRSRSSYIKRLQSCMGSLDFQEGCYLIITRAII